MYHYSHLCNILWLRLESGTDMKYREDRTKEALHCDKFNTFWMVFEAGMMRFGKGCTVKMHELASVNISYNGFFNGVTVIGYPINESIVLRFNGE